MPQRILLEDVRVSRSMNAISAGQAANNGTGLDMQLDGGYDGVMFVLAVGTLSSSNTTIMKAQSSSDDASADSYADLEGTATDTTIQSTDSDFLVILDVLNPPERYIRPVVTTAAGNGVIDGVIAIQYRGNTKPSIHDADTVSTSLAVIDPVEGSA